MPKGRAVSTAAVAIDGADSKGKANDKEVCGDAAAVNQRRSQALRRRAAAIQERLDKIKPVAKAPVSAAALAADRVSMTSERVDGIVAETAGKVAFSFASAECVVPYQDGEAQLKTQRTLLVG